MIDSRKLKFCLIVLFLAAIGIGVWQLHNSEQPRADSTEEDSSSSPDSQNLSTRAVSRGELLRSEKDFLRILQIELEGENFGTLIGHASNYKGDGMVLWDWVLETELPPGVTNALLDHALRLLLEQQDKNAVFSLVLTETPEGVKDAIILRFFVRAPIEVGEFESFIDQVNGPVQKKNCATNFGRRFAREKKFDPADLEKLASSEYGKISVIDNLAIHPMMLTSEPLSARKTRLEDSFANAQALLKSGHLDAEMYHSFLEKIVGFVPMEAYEYFREQDELNSLSQSSIQNLVNAMSVKNFREVLSDQFQLFEKANIGNAVFQLASTDRWEADYWMERKFEGLSPEHQSQAQQAFSVISATEKKFDAAWEWIDKIQDPSVQQEAIDQVAGFQKNALQVEVARDPQATLRGIISGDSVHRSEWIKEAFDQWRDDDSAAATTWYEQNRSSLTPEQNQHVARSFADEALKEGELETATEWLGEIIDDRYRSDLESRLQNLESE